MEKLTTSQMLERLGMEDVAINQEGNRVGYDHKGNLLMWLEGEEKPQIKEGNEYTIYYPWMKKDRWEINYLFVNFDEAQFAHAEQKKTVVYYHSDNTQYKFTYGKYGHFKQLANDGIELAELTRGKWIIENY